MESMARPQATLVDLLDRVLDRGLVINADIIISLAGVPLIGVNLRAALAGMETMVKYGIMSDWDQRIRARELESRKGHQTVAMAAAEAPVAGATEVPGA
ncbi:MAG: gas vesicle protein [Dehalococcoidia bacterium]